MVEFQTGTKKCTQKFAFKCCCATVDGEDRDVFKDPVTDSGKRSKKGRLKLISNGIGYETVSLSHAGQDQLVTVFENGKVMKEYSFEEVKQNANA